MAAERLRCNHPSTVLNYWKRNQRPVHSGPKPGHTVTREKGYPRQAHGRPVSWPQDVIKRAAIAMRKDWSNDTSRMARICLEAAIRDDHDLVALMPGPYVQPQKIAQQEPVPLHARSELASCRMIRADGASRPNTGIVECLVHGAPRV